MTGTFEGVGSSLQFSPDNKFAYAYSGTIPGSTTSVDALSFTTQSEYLDGIFQINGPTVYGTQASLVGWMRISFNNQVIAILTVGLVSADSQQTSKQRLIIPPFTDVLVEVVCDDNQALRLTAATFVAKVQGAIEQQNLESITDDNKWAEKGPF